MTPLRESKTLEALRVIVIAFAIVALVFGSIFAIDFYKARKAQQENARMTLVKSVVREKVEAYYSATGHYPDSIAVLAFTNSPGEIDVLPDLPKIYYRLTPSGYAIGWDGVYSHNR